MVFGGVGTEDEVEGRAGSSWPCLGESVAGRCVSGFSHFVPTARVVGYAWRLPTFCPYGALAVVGLPGRWLGASVAGRLVSECRSLGLPGGGRKAAVPLGDTAWSLTLASTSAGAVPGFSWGRLRLVFGGVGTEDEVEGRAGSSWPCLGESVAGRCVSGFSHFVPTARVVGYAWRLPTFCPYGALAVVGLPGRGLGASVAGRLVSECRSLGLPGGGRKAAVPLGDTAWSLTLASTSAGAVPGFSWGRLRLVFGGVGTEDEVEGRAGSSWPCLGESVAGRCVSGFSHFVPTARVVGYAWRLPTFCPYGALAVVGLPGAVSWGEQCRSVGLGVPVAWSAGRRSQSGRAPG